MGSGGSKAKADAGAASEASAAPPSKQQKKEAAQAAKEEAKREAQRKKDEEKAKKDEEKAKKDEAKKETQKQKEEGQAESASAAKDDKKKKVNSNLEERKQMMEKTMGAGQMSTQELDDIIKKAENNQSSLKEINLNNSPMFAKMSKERRIEKQVQLANALAKNTHVTALYLANCQVDDPVAEAVAQALAENTAVTILSLESNHITGVGIIAVAKMLATNKALQELRLNNQRHLIATEAEEALMEAMETNDTLMRLNLDIRTTQAREKVQAKLTANVDAQRQTRQDDAKEKAVANLTPLQRKIMSVVSDNYDKDELDISGDLEFTKMKETEKTGIADGLANNTHIKVLKLNKVQLRDSFAEAMGKALKTNTTLEVLSLESNGITSFGIIALAEGLKENKTLKELRLMSQMSQASTDAENSLVAMFEVNMTLVKLGLQIRDATARERINKALARNTDLVRKARAAGK